MAPANDSTDALKKLLSNFDQELTKQRSKAVKEHEADVNAQNPDIALLEKVKPLFREWLEFQSDIKDVKGHNLSDKEKDPLIERGKKLADDFGAFQISKGSKRFYEFHDWLRNETMGALLTLGYEHSKPDSTKPNKPAKKEPFKGVPLKGARNSGTPPSSPKPGTSPSTPKPGTSPSTPKSGTTSSSPKPETPTSSPKTGTPSGPPKPKPPGSPNKKTPGPPKAKTPGNKKGKTPRTPKKQTPGNQKAKSPGNQNQPSSPDQKKKKKKK